MIATVLVAGIGNTLAGDDGAGIVALRLIRRFCPQSPARAFISLGSNLYGIADHCAQACHIIFLDAVIGTPKGEVRRCRNTVMPQPSLHSTNIGAVMLQLRALAIANPFPTWEVWGISVTPPFELGAGLSEEVRCGIYTLAKQLSDEVIVKGHAS
jgi:hydrogenase maturation protease